MEMVEGHYHVFLTSNNSGDSKMSKELRKTSKMKQRDYKAFIENITDKAYAKRYTPVQQEHNVWHEAHQDVYHPNKPRKIRAVFDCNIKLQGKSINVELMLIAALTNHIGGVFLRF